jgi:hypothetical protein
MARTPSNRFCSRIIAASLFANDQGSATTIAAWRALMERVAAAVRLLPLSPLETGPNPCLECPQLLQSAVISVPLSSFTVMGYNPTIVIFRDGDSLVYINGRVAGSWSNGTILSATQGGQCLNRKPWSRR